MSSQTDLVCTIRIVYASLGVRQLSSTHSTHVQCACPRRRCRRRCARKQAYVYNFANTRGSAVPRLAHRVGSDRTSKGVWGARDIVVERANQLLLASSSSQTGSRHDASAAHPYACEDHTPARRKSRRPQCEPFCATHAYERATQHPCRSSGFSKRTLCDEWVYCTSMFMFQQQRRAYYRKRARVLRIGQTIAICVNFMAFHRQP